MQSGQERYYQRFYLNMDREKFDRWLLSLVPDTVDVCCPAVVKEVHREDSLYRLHFLQVDHPQRPDAHSGRRPGTRRKPAKKH